MAGTREREELRRLVDDLSDDQVHEALAAVKQVQAGPRQPADDQAGLAWIGIIEDGPQDLASNTKRILRNDMGRRHGPAA